MSGTINYLNLVEEYPRQPVMTQFEKVLMTAKRAKDLHNEDKAPYVEDDHKAAYLALAELKAKAIGLVYKEEEPVKINRGDDAFDSEEDEG
ncbi:MAG: DNA-directed RNA polymerase subunit omega [Deltaproteobacteria bacterium]|nr:DNA-directed RNA polymerase subunit omega [Deltaproteobacteria bacterium]